MCSSTTAERQSLASRDRTCCLRRCLPARPLRFYGFRGSIAHPTQSLCTLRTRRRRRPRNTRYRAPATAYPDRSLTGRTTPALPGAQAIHRAQERMDCFVATLLAKTTNTASFYWLHFRSGSQEPPVGGRLEGCAPPIGLSTHGSRRRKSASSP